MTDDDVIPIGQDLTLGHDALIESLGSGKYKKYVRFILAALSSIPWVGGVLGAISGFTAEKDQEKISDLHKFWLEEHRRKIRELGITLVDIFERLDNFGDEIKDRTESPEYLSLVRQTFRSWDQADTVEKRQMLKRLITNAGATKLCDDDLVRLFINWTNQYHEAHFIVIREIYKNPGITRGGIWDNIHGQRPKENSSKADLFKYLIRDLSTGGVIRQQRETNYDGNFVKKRTQHVPKGAGSTTMESAFEDSKPYVLTELGKEFVHYVMDDAVTRISGPAK